MKLAKAGYEIAWKTLDPFPMLMFFLGIAYWVLGWFTISIVVFLRRDFGERYLSWINLFFGYTVVANFAFLLNGMLAGFTTAGLSWTMPLFWLAFIGLSGCHRFVIWIRNRAGVAWHSLCSGRSWLEALLPISIENLQKWVEPALVAGTGMVIWSLFNDSLGLWLLISGVALLVYEQLGYFFTRQSLLDARDAQIQAQYLHAALSGTEAARTAGFTIASSNRQLLHQVSAASAEEAVARAASGFGEPFAAQPGGAA